ncbi:MAG: hypothetical protein LBI57_01945 [Helicobacteraceae bacterium]|jgi:hypothetical protein|nr:hypothetical protein [Helicobacteraceae bacterium]
MIWLVGFAFAFVGMLFAGDYWWALAVVSFGCLVGYFVAEGKKALDKDAEIRGRFLQENAIKNARETKQESAPKSI